MEWSAERENSEQQNVKSARQWQYGRCRALGVQYVLGGVVIGPKRIVCMIVTDAQYSEEFLSEIQLRAQLFEEGMFGNAWTGRYIQCGGQNR